MYTETKFVKYHSNVLGSLTVQSHPVAWELPSGEIVKCDEEARMNALEKQYMEGKKGYAQLHQNVKFKILQQWDNDANTSGSRIRWCVPKGSQAIYDSEEE